MAREHYELQRKTLTGRLGGFAFGREWPRGIAGSYDIDSGFTPFGMGPASTGFALIAAKEFDDRELFAGLLAFIELVGVPQTQDWLPTS